MKNILLSIAVIVMLLSPIINNTVRGEDCGGFTKVGTLGCD